MIIIQNMKKDLSYLSPEGYSVFTSEYLKKRGTCCKSACLHCPYGYTLKKHGLEFVSVEDTDHEKIVEIMALSGQSVDFKSFFPENVKLIKLKGTLAGVMLKNHIVIKHLILLPRFTEQDLSREMVESYFFC